MFKGEPPANHFTFFPFLSLSLDPLFALPSEAGQNPKAAPPGTFVGKGPKNKGGRPRVGDDVVVRILRMRDVGHGCKRIAEVLTADGQPISATTVWRILQRKDTMESHQEDGDA